MLNRRSFFKGLAAAGVTAGLAMRSLLPAEVADARRRRRKKKTLSVYHLDPTYECGPRQWRHHNDREDGHHREGDSRRRRRTCEGCNACKQHAANKLFSSRQALWRAHENCNCDIVEERIPQQAWYGYFGFPGCRRQGRKEFDKRRDTKYSPC